MYNHAPANYTCPFCALVRGFEHEGVHSLHSDVIYQDDLVTAFIGSHQWPNNPGNTIITPNAHYENIYDLPLHFAPRIHELARAIALAMKAVYSCDGVSTRQHNEPAGSQDVWHYHLHVTPRYTNDGFYSSQRAPMPVTERAHHARLLKTRLGDWHPTT